MTTQESETRRLESGVLGDDESRAFAQQLGFIQGKSESFATKEDIGNLRKDIESLKNWITWRVVGAGIVLLAALFAAWRDIILRLPTP